MHLCVCFLYGSEATMELLTALIWKKTAVYW